MNEGRSERGAQTSTVAQLRVTNALSLCLDYLNPQHWALQAETLNVGLGRASFPDG